MDPLTVVADLAVGWAFIGFGTAAWTAGRSASGRLLVAVGVAWFLGTIWPPLEFLHRGPLVHLLATYPTGHLTVRRRGAAWMRVCRRRRRTGERDPVRGDRSSSRQSLPGSSPGCGRLPGLAERCAERR